MTWKDSLRKAICRRCEHNGTDYFTREQLIQWELPTIRSETESIGKTPESARAVWWIKSRARRSGMVLSCRMAGSRRSRPRFCGGMVND